MTQGLSRTGAGSASIGALTAALGADVGFEVSEMRTTRFACPTVGTGRAGGSALRGFGANNASAAWRALAIRSR